MNQSSQAFAPATVANVASGFDILGFAIDGVGDWVTVSISDQKTVTIESVQGIEDSGQIPLEARRNTAGLPLLLMLEKYKPDFGFNVRLKKGIPLGSGMGGSAASAVGAVVAAQDLLLKNRVLTNKLSKAEIIHFALEGEALASGSKHADNLAPCLHGGFTFSYPGPVPQVVAVPYPASLFCALVHPGIRVDTQSARKILKKDLSLETHIGQSARLSALLLGLGSGDLQLIRQGLEDLLIEPQRASLIPHFAEVKDAAMKSGALGCSISGAGPAMFALTSSAETAQKIASAMLSVFLKAGMNAKSFVSPIRSRGAEIT